MLGTVLYLLFTASASWVAFYKQGILRTLNSSRDCTGQVVRLRACGTMEPIIMKYHVLSCSAGKNLAEDQDQAKILYGYSLTKTSKNNSKSWFLVSRICIFHLNVPSSSFVRHLPPVLLKREKFTLYLLPSLALGFWVGTCGRIYALSSFF